MEMVPFNFKDIRPALLKLRCAVGNGGKVITRKHLGPLDKLATSLNVTPYARENAEWLATGYEDLVVVFLEPNDFAEDVSHDETFNASDALQYLDSSLLLAFDGQRCVANTIVLDVRSFRSARIRTRQREEERAVDDERAYAEFEEMFALLCPDVVLVCQCQTADAQNDTATKLCSSIEASGRVNLHVMPNGHKAVKDERDRELDRVLIINHQRQIEQHGIGHLNYAKSTQGQKGDVLEEMGFLVSELPDGLVPFGAVRVNAAAPKVYESSGKTVAVRKLSFSYCPV